MKIGRKKIFHTNYSHSHFTVVMYETHNYRKCIVVCVHVGMNMEDLLVCWKLKQRITCELLSFLLDD